MYSVTEQAKHVWEYSQNLQDPLTLGTFNIAQETIFSGYQPKVPTQTIPLHILYEYSGVDASHFLRERLSTLREAESVFYRIVEVEREPGFVIDLLIIMNNDDRDARRFVLSAVGNLMRERPDLLIDFRIVNRRNRDLREVIPEGFIEQK
jgi:hypothetical protein